MTAAQAGDARPQNKGRKMIPGIARGLLTLSASLPVYLFAEAAPSDFIAVRWEQITALVALIVVLLFIVTKLIPDVLKQGAEQSKVFAAASQAQTDSSVRATADASAKATAAMAVMHGDYVTTLDKMATRYHDDTTQLAEAVAELAKSCAVNCGNGSTIHRLRKQLHEEQGQ